MPQIGSSVLSSLGSTEETDVIVMLRLMKALHELGFYDVLLAIDSFAGLVTYLMENSTVILLLQFLLRIGFFERMETILCAGAVVWSLSPASDVDELS